MNIFRTFYMTLSFFLFFAPLPLAAMADEMRSEIVKFEEEVIAQNPDIIYIDLGERQSNIREIIAQLTDLDDQDDSPLQALNKHIRDGFSIAEYDAVVEALTYALSMLHNSFATSDNENV